MKVRLKTNVLWSATGDISTPAGTTVDVSEEMAEDWIKRGIAEKPHPTPAPPSPPAPAPYAMPTKGKR